MNKQVSVGKWTMSQRLQFAAFMVAGPRYIALGAMALGKQPEATVPLFLYLEIASWLGFAILEGYAIPYIAKGIRRFAIRSFEWWQLQVYRALLLLAIPTLGAPLYLAISSQKQTAEGIIQGLTMVETLGVAGFVVWAFLLTGMGALVIDAVGTCESVNEPDGERNGNNNYYPKGNNGRISVAEKARFWAGYYYEATPDEFSRLFEDETGLGLTVEEAEAALAEARAVAGRNGRGRK